MRHFSVQFGDKRIHMLRISRKKRAGEETEWLTPLLLALPQNLLILRDAENPVAPASLATSCQRILVLVNYAGFTDCSVEIVVTLAPSRTRLSTILTLSSLLPYLPSSRCSVFKVHS